MSTSTALTIVGAAAGFAMGGPAGAQWGAMIGGTIGGMMTANATHMRGPRLSDLSTQTATYGANIPRLYGSIAVSGNVFWIENNKLKEVPTTEARACPQDQRRQGQRPQNDKLHV